MGPNHGREINMVTAARGPAWSPKGMAIRSGAGNSLSGHSQNQTTTCGLLSTHMVFPLFPQTYQVHLLTFCFNPRTREGCDPFLTKDQYAIFLFQSTHPRGVRQASIGFYP